jgi:hypothetical protein
MSTRQRTLSWIGWTISGLIAAMMAFSATMKFLYPPEVAEQFVGKFGYPDHLALYLGIAELSCVILFLIPPTAVLGGVVLTGYLGGAVATHVRVQDNFLGPVLVGVFVWLALYLREPRLRALLPLRRTDASTDPAGRSA